MIIPIKYSPHDYITSQGDLRADGPNTFRSLTQGANWVSTRVGGKDKLVYDVASATTVVIYT